MLIVYLSLKIQKLQIIIEDTDGGAREKQTIRGVPLIERKIKCVHTNNFCTVNRAQYCVSDKSCDVNEHVMDKLNFFFFFHVRSSTRVKCDSNVIYKNAGIVAQESRAKL